MSLNGVSLRPLKLMVQSMELTIIWAEMVSWDLYETTNNVSWKTIWGLFLEDLCIHQKRREPRIEPYSNQWPLCWWSVIQSISQNNTTPGTILDLRYVVRIAKSTQSNMPWISRKRHWGWTATNPLHLKLAPRTQRSLLLPFWNPNWW